ncbi:MAG TPA: hypothetical protein VG737_04950 [Cyclobacteriaceae bacterium]|nr:hypothetical protein [Cyclobacteriaceae bacterium]
MVNLIPYYKKTITTDRSSDDVLQTVSAIIKKNSTEVLEESPDFIGGTVEEQKFALWKSTGMARRGFPVKATASANDDGTWTVVFKTTGWWQWVFLIFLTLWSFYYSFLFFLPIVPISYVFGIIAFNKDVRAFGENS